MQSYVARRLVQMIPLIVGITLITFLISRLAPGDPILLMVDPRADPAEIARLQAHYGLDRPVILQYFGWVKELVTGNLGFSIRRSRPVLDMILERLPATLMLTLTAWLLGFLIAIPIGVYSAMRKYSLSDYALTVVTFFGISMPSFFLGLAMIYLFSIQLGWLPSHGMYTVGRNLEGLALIGDRLRHIIMPVIVLALPQIAEVMRYTRSSMLDVIESDYIRTARAKGLSERVVVYKHAFKNAIIPVITLIGLTIPALFGGAFIMETVFVWPGIGKLGVDAIYARDYPIVMGINLFTATLVLVGNLIADILYATANPQIRY